MHMIDPNCVATQIDGITKNGWFFRGPITILFEELFQKIKNENPTYVLTYNVHDDMDSLPSDPYGFILHWKPKI